MSKKTLFIHYGPGGNADVESRWFNDEATYIFWNQPRLENEFTFETIYSLYKQKVEELLSSHKVMNLCAHSFGTDVAVELAKEFVDSIEEMTLISPITSLSNGFLEFGKKVFSKNPGKESLKNSIQLFVDEKRDDQKMTQFWGMVNEIFQTEGVYSYYWGNPEAFNKFMNVASETDSLNMNEWQKVLDHYMRSPKKVYDQIPEVKMKVVLGELDPYYNLKNEVLFWENAVGKENLITVPGAGHYPHLEKSKLRW